MKTLLTSIALAGFGIALGGCAFDTRTPDGRASGDASDLSASSRSYVGLTADQRKCASPMCGGYYLHDVNRISVPTYVSGLDFAPADLDPSVVDGALRAPLEELVLLGKLSPAEPVHGTRKFLVSELYRGMPGRAPDAGDAFYTTGDRSPAVQCLAAPCNNLVATKVNTSQKTYFTSYSVAGVMPWGDTGWLTSRLESHGAIATASIVRGNHEAGGYDQVFQASQVFVRLPDHAGPCLAVAQPRCPTGEVATFTRSPDRCDVFDQCVTPGPCPFFLPSCGADYTMVKWPRAPHACPGFACYPDFVMQ